MTTLSGIEAFVHTADRRSFRQAAADLGISPAGVSKAVARLEDELGGPLLLRTTRSVALTPEGAIYLEHCRRALHALHAGRDLVSQSLHVAEGTLKASLPYIVGRAVVARMDRLVDRHPRLDVELSFTDRNVNLVDEEVDVVVRVGALADSTLIARPLRTPRWVTVAAPAYLARHPTPKVPEDLAAHRCLKFKRPRGALAHFRFRAQDGGERVVPTPTQVTLDQGDLLVEAAVAGLGVAQVFDYMVTGPLAEGALVELLAEHATDGPPFWALCLPRQRKTPRIRAFLDFLSETLGDGARPP